MRAPLTPRKGPRVLLPCPAAGISRRDARSHHGNDVRALLRHVPMTRPSTRAAGTARPAILEGNRKALGYDQPVYVQYGKFLKGLVVGRDYPDNAQLRARTTRSRSSHCPAPCLGYSPTQSRTINAMVGDAWPISISIAIGAFVLWMIVGVGGGIIAALNRGRWPDRIIVGLALIGFSATHVLHRPRPAHVRRDQGRPAAHPQLRAVHPEPVRVGAQPDPPLDHAGLHLRRELRATDPRVHDRDDERGLHPYRHVQGPRQVAHHLPPRPARRADAHRHRRRPRPRRPARRRHHHRERLLPPRARLHGRVVGDQHGPAGDRGDGA